MPATKSNTRSPRKKNKFSSDEEDSEDERDSHEEPAEQLERVPLSNRQRNSLSKAKTKYPPLTPASRPAKSRCSKNARQPSPNRPR